jgi:hypothetical protein
VQKVPVSFIISFHPSICLSFCLHVPVLPLLDEFLWNLILGIFMKLWWENLNLVKIGQTYQRLHEDLKNVLMFPATLNHHKSAVLKWNGMRLLGLLRSYKQYVNMPWCYIIYTDIQLHFIHDDLVTQHSLPKLQRQIIRTSTVHVCCI